MQIADIELEIDFFNLLCGHKKRVPKNKTAGLGKKWLNCTTFRYKKPKLPVSQRNLKVFSAEWFLS